MIVLDAYALIALLADEPAAEEVEALLRSPGTGMTSVNLAEAVDVAGRVYGLPHEDVRLFLEPLFADALTLAPLRAKHAWRAADLRGRYYRRRERPISLADCFLLAAASAEDGVATADPAVAEVAQAEGIDLVPLPDRRGRRPSTE